MYRAGERCSLCDGSGRCRIRDEKLDFIANCVECKPFHTNDADIKFRRLTRIVYAKRRSEKTRVDNMMAMPLHAHNDYILKALCVIIAIIVFLLYSKYQ
jgi:hypothetical protein